MLDGLNKIDITGWRDDPNVSTQIALEIEKASWRKCPFESMVGSGTERGIRVYKVDKKGAYRPRLKAALTGEGVRGNADFETNFDNLEILAQTIYPDNIGNSTKSATEFIQQMEQVDFIKESADSLSDWDAMQRDRAFAAALFNDITNIVVADATKGYKDSSKKTSTTEAAKEIVAGDVLTVAAIRRAIFMATAGVTYQNKASFPIKPIRASTVSINGIHIQHYSYLILLDSYGVNQLKNDSEWQEMQKSAGVRGDENRLFTGLVGMIDNCPVIDIGVWSVFQSGLVNSETPESSFKNALVEENYTKKTMPAEYQKNQPVCMGFLIGASALVMAGDPVPKFYIDEKQDLGRKTACAISRIRTVAKARFEPTQKGILSAYAGQDFGVIGIAYSKE